jgi:protein involved in polysaccharide export with SLBB domain
MAEGDIVQIYSMVPVYRRTVILRGNISNPGRFSWHPGMRVSELIPDKESLITRDYWWRRAQLGLPAPEFEPVPDFGDQKQPTNNRPMTIKPSAPQTQQEANAAEPEPDRVPSGNAATKASIAATQNEATSNRIVATQRTEIRSLAAEIDWNYAVIERLDPETLKTKLIPFDLGKLVLQHDASQDLELQAGDTVSILSEDDIRVPIAQQTKIVRLDGEIVHAGVYTAQPGETLRQLIERAGGLTSNAYLYGSELTRASTRAIQQARIDEYVQNLSFNIQRGNLALAVSSAASGAASAEGSEQNLLSALRQIKATGRIVLEIKPGDNGLEALPNLALEDGDHFSVPSTPSNVNVVGAVYDQNSFLYKTARRSGQYLQLAGGANRNSDQKHSFIIRANGEVLSRDNSTGFWKDDFAKLHMYPGDTIVVPEKMLKIPTLRTVMEWTQLFSQLALTAAALHSIQ